MDGNRQRHGMDRFSGSHRQEAGQALGRDVWCMLLPCKGATAGGRAFVSSFQGIVSFSWTVPQRCLGVVVPALQSEGRAAGYESLIPQVIHGLSRAPLFQASWRPVLPAFQDAPPSKCPGLPVGRLLTTRGREAGPFSSPFSSPRRSTDGRDRCRMTTAPAMDPW
jgi:hypothetical protein